MGDHFKYYNNNAFCSAAGLEELALRQRLIGDLNDTELQAHVDVNGITFERKASRIERDVLEGVIDETDREDFYK